MTSSHTINVIKFTLKIKHMLVENNYNWFCFSICSETQVIINKSKNGPDGKYFLAAWAVSKSVHWC